MMMRAIDNNHNAGVDARVSTAEQDLQLVRQVQEGNKQAYNLLVSRYQHKVASLVSRFVKNHADVADVVQEAFIKAYRALPGFRGESAFYTWLYRIAVNCAKNHLVANQRKPSSSEIDAEEAEYFEGGEALHEHETPENLLLTKELKHVVFRAMENLPDELRIAITLRELDGLAYEEIAQIMDCPVGTVRSRIFRAREAIDNALRPLISNR